MSANAKQVGGSHYRSGYQHWDFAVDACLGPFEYQITKYGTRHRGKAGKQDLEKALHFADKLYELASAGYAPRHGFVRSGLITWYVEENKLEPMEADLIRIVCTWTDSGSALALREHLRYMLTQYYPEWSARPLTVEQARHVTALQPQPRGYVNQDGLACDRGADGAMHPVR